jgi:hypothetical protein
MSTTKPTRIDLNSLSFMIVSFLFIYKGPSKDLFTKRNPSHVYSTSPPPARPLLSRRLLLMHPTARRGRGRVPTSALGSGASRGSATAARLRSMVVPRRSEAVCLSVLERRVSPSPSPYPPATTFSPTTTFSSGVFGWLQADTVAAVWTAAAAIHREKNTVEAAAAAGLQPQQAAANKLII